MTLRIQYASYLAMNTLRHTIRPVGDVLVLAGGTGPLSSLPVQLFYRWCSKNFRETYTLLDETEERKVGSLLSNVHVLNQDYHFLPETGHIISADTRYLHADIHVGNQMRGSGKIAHIHSQGSFGVYSIHGIYHTANSCKNRFYSPEKVMILSDDHIHALQ